MADCWGPRLVPVEAYDRLMTGIHSIMVLDGDNSARGYGFSHIPRSVLSSVLA